MSDSVIVIVANESYIPQVKSLMVNCRRQGNWKGDFCFIAAKNVQASSLARPGIEIMVAPDEEWSMQTKFHVFSDYFRKWDRVLCLDCDVMVQGDLNVACDKLAEKFPSICCDGGQQPEEGPVVRQWEYFDDCFGKGKGRQAHPELYDRLYDRFDCMDKLTYTVDIMFFSPQSIAPGTVATLQATHDEFREANLGKADQPVVVSVLYDQMTPITKDFGCWFPFDEPSHRVAQRGWHGKEEPVILHYFSWFAPWIVKYLSVNPGDPEPGAYRNYRLGRVCHELYAENLAAFDKEFPIT